MTNLMKRTFVTGLFMASLFLAMNEASAQPGRSSEGATRVSIFPPRQEVEQEGLNPHVGVTVGVANPEGSYRSGAEYGLNVGLQPYVPFGLGMSLTFSKNKGKEAGQRDLDRTAILVRGTYNFGGTITVIKNSFIGVATGPIVNQDATYFALAPVLGFDIPVREWSGKYLSYLTFGAEAKYTMVSSDESDGLTVNGAIKYWF